MKYFVPIRWDEYSYSWPVDNDIPRPIEAQIAKYEEHLARMQGVLPETIIKLAKLPGFDDGVIVLVRHDRAKRILSLTLRSANAIMGCFDLTLRYLNAEISTEHELMLACLARTPLYRGGWGADTSQHELDITDKGQIEHRISFHGGFWFAVRCRDMQWAQIPKANLKIPRRRDRFPGGPVTSLETMASVFPRFDHERNMWRMDVAPYNHQNR